MSTSNKKTKSPPRYKYTKLKNKNMEIQPKSKLVCSIQRTENGIKLDIKSDIDFSSILGLSKSVYNLGGQSVLRINPEMAEKFDGVTFIVDSARSNKLFDSGKKVNLAFLLPVNNITNGVTYELTEHPYSDDIFKQF